ncbi:MAG TPA: tail fiber protein [Candidatus Dormibacteraeota bacterium]|nr:tail fiber protein [Candidatus Dormibacteraeota bacterium]
MSDQFVAEIRMFAGNFAPTGWAMCNGQLLPISQNTALFSLLGTQYGGNGTSTFALPNLMGAAPMHFGQGPGLSIRNIGDSGGSPAVTLLTTEIPSHTHSAMGFSTSKADQTSPLNHAWSKAQSGRQPLTMYSATPGTSPAMSAAALGNVGGSPHNNLMPYQTLNFIIALQGIFPPRS